MGEKIKLCKNCKYYKNRIIWAECRHKEAVVRTNYTNGRLTYFLAQLQREFRCGVEAKFYEAKK